ncbi:RbsD/FucU family protein [Streptomyces coryli]|nr:RbsD/FucU domain-containing protein [Streptomyces coryli]
MNIHPYLTGDLLRHLDAMGHGDTVVLADAHFPAARTAAAHGRILDFPGVTTPGLLAAIRTVIPLDEHETALYLMSSPDGRLPVQDELIGAAGAQAKDVRELQRGDFYTAAEAGFLVIRTGETRTYGNAILRKGVVS